MRTFSLPAPVDLLASLRPLVHAASDPTIRLRADGVARASRTPEGAGTVEVTRHGDIFVARAWGPGADWLLEHAPGLVGADDQLAGFVPDRHRAVARAAHRHPGLRLPRTGVAWDLLVPTILAQRITSREAGRSWSRLVHRWGEPAPGPHGLRLPPAPERLAATPYFAYHPLGVEQARARAVIAASRAARRIQEAIALPSGAAVQRLCAVPGLGPWTAALVLRGAAGDADQVEVGDYHVKNQISWALAGEARGTDERMLELLAAYPGHRGRVVRLMLVDGVRAPAFGARQRIVPVETL